MSVIWHDLECGAYVEDMALWRSLAAECGDPILDVGAGTGRIALDLARRGHRVTALDADRALLAELEQRADGLKLETVVADAREFELRERFALCIVPMQTVQLLGGVAGRRAFLACARRHLAPGGQLAAAITAGLELYELSDDMVPPLPDICERDGVVYSSYPTAVRADGDGFVLERRRETVDVDGIRSLGHDLTRIDALTADQLEREGSAVGLRPGARRAVPATTEFTGSTVVILRG